jgi:hypothetical protein
MQSFFFAFMRIHICGIRLWGILSGEVSFPPRTIAPLAHAQPTPLIPGENVLFDTLLNMVPLFDTG